MPDLNLFYKHVQLNDLLSVCVVVYGATTVLCFAVCTCFVEYPGDGAIYILTNNSWKKLDGCAHHKFLAFDGYKLTESSIDLPQTIKVPLEKGKTIEVYYHIKKGNILIVLNEIGPSVWTEFSFQCDNYFTPVIQKIFYTEVAQIPEDNEEQRLQSWKKLLSSYGVTVDRVEVY